MTNKAIQNWGRQAVILAIRVTAVSAGRPLYTALITPKNIPRGMLIINAVIEKNKVMGIRSLITSKVLL